MINSEHSERVINNQAEDTVIGSMVRVMTESYDFINDELNGYIECCTYPIGDVNSISNEDMEYIKDHYLSILEKLANLINPMVNGDKSKLDPHAQLFTNLVMTINTHT